MTTRVQPLAQPQPHPSLTPRHTDSHIRSLLRPFGGQPAMGTVVPSLSPQKQDLSKTIQAGPTAGPERTRCPLPTSVHSLPGRATISPHPPCSETSGLLQECPPPPSCPAQGSAALWPQRWPFRLGSLLLPAGEPPEGGTVEQGIGRGAIHPCCRRACVLASGVGPLPSRHGEV